MCQVNASLSILFCLSMHHQTMKYACSRLCALPLCLHYFFLFLFSSLQRLRRRRRRSMEEIGYGDRREKKKEDERQLTGRSHRIKNRYFHSNFNQIDFDMHILPCYPSNKLTDMHLTFEGEDCQSVRRRERHEERARE